MNVGFLSKTSYLNSYQNTNGNSISSDINNSYSEILKNEKMSNTEKMRTMLRDLERNNKKDNGQFSIYSKDGRLKDIWEMSKTSDKDKPKVKKRLNYNYKEISTKILRAKNSITAGQAMLSAKRKVLEIKRKIQSGDGDSDELQTALTHATRMEMAARKKKHNIEQEELAEITRKRDERFDEMEEAASDMRNQMIGAAEDEISEAEDDIFEEREAMLEEMHEEIEERNEEISEEMMAELNEKIAEFGEEALREMEEAMAALEELEMIDPHMSEEELEKVKRKHRLAEEKAILKADMDYLKDTIKHQQMAQMSSMPGFGNSNSSFDASSFSASVGGADIAVSASADVSAPAIDVSA